MGLWEDLLTTAVVGAERRALAVSAPAGALGEVAAGLGGRAPETTLLGLAAATELHGRAGRVPALDRQPRPAPAPAEDLPRCSARAGVRLRRILDHEERVVLPEWLAAVAAVGRRVPETALPTLLEAGRHSRDLQPAILAVLGGRGRWLAAQNPDWSWAIGVGDAEADWQTGGRAARLAVLVQERQSVPDQARDRLAATWGQETAEDRAAFIQTFEIGLSMADEPFLEAALDDRRKEVRTAAAGLLARLPESRLVARMIERLEPRLRFAPADQPSLLKLVTGRRTGRLTVSLPDGWTCDKAMTRDGIEAKPPPYPKIGQKAWWLQQLLGRVPPAHWSEVWRIAPEDALESIKKHDYHNALVEGWLAATVLHGDARWVEALLKRTPARVDLLRGLPQAQREAAILDMLRFKMDDSADQGLLQALGELPVPWSEAVARAALRWIQRYAGSGNQRNYWRASSVLDGPCGVAIPPSLVHEAATGWPTDTKLKERWQPAVDRFLSTLQFRHDMLKEIEE